MTLPEKALLIARLALLTAIVAVVCVIAAIANAGEPKAYCFVQIGGVSHLHPGSIHPTVATKGWHVYVNDVVKPQLAWAGRDFGLIVHNAFGTWNNAMELDSYDFAKACGNERYTRDFVQAWGPICDSRECLAYVGNVNLHQRLTGLTGPELAKVIRRNLEPYKQAGFKGIVLDASCDAINHPANVEGEYPVVPGKIGVQPGDVLALSIADYMFPNPTGVEVLPRRFPMWAPLCQRPGWITEGAFQVRHGKDSEGQTRNGWGPDLSYMKGRIHRCVVGFGPQETAARVKEVIAAGHVPAFPAYLLQGAGIKASEVGGK